MAQQSPRYNRFAMRRTAEGATNMRILSFAAVLVISSSSALAGPRDDVIAAMGKCTTISDDRARLACYDGLTPWLEEALGTPSDALQGNRAPTEDEQKSWFGFNLGSLSGASPKQQTTLQKFGSDKLPETQAQADAAETIDSISAGISDYAFTPFGRFIVFLDNGQVWRQEEGDSDRAYFYKSPKDNTVTIGRGAFGSYNLKINDSNKIYKVTRVK
jgi:hypothetical protein